MDTRLLQELVRETNKIEGIIRSPRKEEVQELDRFLQTPSLSVGELTAFVSVFEPTAFLRTQSGANVRVGTHSPPPGGMHILYRLDELLFDINQDIITPYQGHVRYETLHPFTDGNGRSGRAVWAWHMIHEGREKTLDLGFLHAFYYQALSESSER
jgi:hypothetical protein